MIATRVFHTTEDPHYYRCRRCGIDREQRVGRQTLFCTDCVEVEGLILTEYVLRQLDAGHTRQAVADELGVSLAALKARLIRHRRLERALS